MKQEFKERTPLYAKLKSRVIETILWKMPGESFKMADGFSTNEDNNLACKINVFRTKEKDL